MCGKEHTAEILLPCATEKRMPSTRARLNRITVAVWSITVTQGRRSRAGAWVGHFGCGAPTAARGQAMKRWIGWSGATTQFVQCPPMNKPRLPKERILNRRRMSVNRKSGCGCDGFGSENSVRRLRFDFRTFGAKEGQLTPPARDRWNSIAVVQL
jgi:hypothetical protein